MKKNKTLKVLKILLIIILVVLIIAAAAVALLYKLVVVPHSTEIENAVEIVMNDEEIRNRIEPYLSSETLEQLEQNGEIGKIGEIGEQIESLTESKIKSGQTGEKSTELKITPKKSPSEYASKYDYVKDNVEPSDFAKGMALAGKIDVGYVLGLLSGGLTPDEKQELKEYLTSHFSSGEIAEGISLYSKYSGLLK